MDGAWQQLLELWESVGVFFAFDFVLADSALAFRLSRRCTLVIASISSSFRIPCQPETP